MDRSGVVYFTNTRPPQVLTWDPARRVLGVFREKSGGANGLILDREGRLLACEGTPAGSPGPTAAARQVTVLADQYQGHPLGAPNDLDLDGKGRIYFTSRLGNRDPKAGNVNAVYRIDPDGDARADPGRPGDRQAERDRDRARRCDALPDRRRRRRGPRPPDPRLRPEARRDRRQRAPPLRLLPRPQRRRHDDRRRGQPLRRRRASTAAGMRPRRSTPGPAST